MRVLMLSQDLKIFDDGPVAARMASYGAIFDELTIIVLGTGKRREKILALNVHAIAPGGNTKATGFFVGWRELFRCIAASAYDVVSAQDPFFLGVLGLIAAWRVRVPLQVQLHTDCFSKEFIRGHPRRVLESFLARFVFAHASCVRVVSTRIEKSVRQITRAPVSILPVFTSLRAPARTERASDGALHLVVVSRLTKEKRVHLIIEAMQSVPEAHLTIVGDGPLRGALEALAKRLNVGDRVVYAGWQDPASYYATADAFVQASRYEGYGMTLIEAAEAALPIVTTDVGIVGEVLRDGQEALVVSGTPASFAEAFRRLIAEPGLRERLGQSARAHAAEHSLSGEQYLAAYRAALMTCLS